MLTSAFVRFGHVSVRMSTPAEAMLKPRKLGGYEFYRSIGRCGLELPLSFEHVAPVTIFTPLTRCCCRNSPRFLVAPMVEQSELAFRLLTKRYGAQLTYSPMVHARILTERGASSEQWVRELLTTPGERPMIVQVKFNTFLSKCRSRHRTQPCRPVI